jgi:hypothetical protein
LRVAADPPSDRRSDQEYRRKKSRSQLTLGRLTLGRLLRSDREGSLL